MDGARKHLSLSVWASQGLVTTELGLSVITLKKLRVRLCLLTV